MGRPRATEPGWVPTNRFSSKKVGSRRGRPAKKVKGVHLTLQQYIDLFMDMCTDMMTKRGTLEVRNNFIALAGPLVEEVQKIFSNEEHVKSVIRSAMANITQKTHKETARLTWALNKVICKPMTKKDVELAIVQREQNVLSRIKDPVVLTENQVRGVVEDLRKERQKSLPMDFIKAFVWLQLMSGCRKIELLDSRVSSFRLAVTGDFHEADIVAYAHKPEHYILQIGASKMKGYRDLGVAVNVVESHLKFMPFGQSPSEWLQILRALRFQIGNLDGVSTIQLGAKFARRLQTQTKLSFHWLSTVYAGGKHHKMGTHFNRAVYANLCALQEKRLPGQTDSVAAVMTAALAHTGRHNSKFYEAVSVIPDDNKDDSKRVGRLLEEQEQKRRDPASKVTVVIEETTFEKFRKQWRTERMKRMDVERGESMLIDAGVPPTFANLKKLGLCSTTITRFHDKSLVV